MTSNTQRASQASSPATSLANRVAGGMPPAAGKRLDDGRPNAALMQRVGAGDHAALAELYDLCAAPIFGLCLRILGDQALAEDALQEVFLRVWARARLFEPTRGAAMAWLTSVTRNTCIDQLRRIQTRPQAAEQPEGPEALPFEETLVDPDNDVPAQVAAREEAAQVRQALARLPPEQKLVIELSFFKGLTRREIARQLDWPEGTVHTRARLALHTLRGQLDELVRP